MRHKRHGRVLGRSPSHRKALFRNLVSALVLTERPDADLDANQPKVKGRIVTTLAKAKEVRPLVEKCITIAKKAVLAEEAAAEFDTDAERNTEEWKKWRGSENYRKWQEATAPAVNARRRLFQIIRSKEAVSILVDEIAERFMDREGGYTRIMRLAIPRLGDNGVRAILEFVGKNDRVISRSEKPAFEQDAEEQDAEESAVADETAEADADADSVEEEAAEAEKSQKSNPQTLVTENCHG